MKNKIYKIVLQTSTLVMITSVLFVIFILHGYFTDIRNEQQKNLLNVIAEMLNEEKSNKNITKIPLSKERINIITPDGKVTYDNQINVNELQNHKKREEIQKAIKYGYGESKRYSATLSKRTLYSAKLLENGQILRISIDQPTIITMTWALIQPIIIIFIVIMFISAIIAQKTARNMVAPINALDLKNPMSNDTYQEIYPLLKRITQQNKEIDKHIEEIEEKTKEMQSIMENVSDAIIILNEKGNIVTANKKAKELLHCKEKDYYMDFYRNATYSEIVENALKGKNSHTLIKINRVPMRLNASSVQTGEEEHSVFLFISDTTDEEKTETMRKEFTANVSHELKTPLAGIMATAEIIKDGIVKEQDIKHFANNIQQESSRLLSLIQDIIKLSSMDENKNPYKKEDIKIKEICEKVKNDLTAKATQKDITISLSGNDPVIKGDTTLLYEAIYNLCDNAITYNKPQGKVTITLEEKNEETLLSIEDTGIGISKENLQRIYERFYREDKSHSKETGGTGLGLSIVKHIAEIHKAEIVTESEKDKGTKITLIFKK
ncbi:MAG: ATP-binding protein [Synergistaceae bacterium]